VGNTTLMRQALECLSSGLGRIHHYRSRSVGAGNRDSSFQLVTGRRWQGTAFGGVRGRTQAAADRRLVYGQRINIDDLITHVLPLESASTKAST